MTEAPLGQVTRGFRQLVGFQDVPGAYCRYGATQVFIATAPSAAYTADFDVAVLSTQYLDPVTGLISDAVADPLPYPYTEPVVKYAAYLATKQNQTRAQEATVFYNEGLRALNDIEGSRVGQLPQPV